MDRVEGKEEKKEENDDDDDAKKGKGAHGWGRGWGATQEGMVSDEVI